jgi:hypothetical protein
MKIRSLKVIALRCMVRALNQADYSNGEIAHHAGIGVEAIARLVSYATRPSPAEIERLEAFALATLPALQPKPVRPIAERLGKRKPLIPYAGWDGPQRPPEAGRDAIGASAAVS